jgi:hypothetical protein
VSAAGALLATLLGASGGELEPAGGAGGDPEAGEQVQGRRVFRLATETIAGHDRAHLLQLDQTITALQR